MRRTSFADMPCSIARALDVVGEWWSLLIVRDAFLGVTRFEEWQRRLGIARNVLATRLEHLVDQGILERRPYQERPPRDEYVLTGKGRDLGPVLAALRTWGDLHEPTPGGPTTMLVHDDCGHATRLVQTCEHCGEPIRSGRTHIEPGPGSPDPTFVRAGRPAD
jgi:DNA-binding HxlR family transcriptional regulator